MKLPIIKLKDNCTGRQFVLTGEDPHDYLYADENGIQYYNLQNGEGIGTYEDCGYSVVGEEGYMGTDIPMVDIVDILLLYHEIEIKPLESDSLNLDFDLIIGHFKALDMRVEAKYKKRAEASKNEQEEIAKFYLDNFYAKKGKRNENI